jgi:hypothetical protein
MGLQSIRERAVVGPASLGGRSRARRWAWFLSLFPDLEQMSVIDLGGDPAFWMGVDRHPKNVHVVNIETYTTPVPEWIEVDTGDACALPGHIASRHYDLVFSNSVLEHVGGHERRLRFAENVHKLGSQHWIQTPYRYFPIEPHWIAPGMQFMPVRVRASMAQWWPLAHVKSKSLREALGGVLWTELVDRTQMRYLFPDSVVRSERLLGFTKSLVAIRTSDG